jgi:hypothetical protein
MQKKTRLVKYISERSNMAFGWGILIQRFRTGNLKKIYSGSVYRAKKNQHILRTKH